MVNSAAATRIPARWSLLVATLGGVIAAAVPVALALTATELEQAGLSALTAAWLIVPYVVAGLIAWRRRPESRLGILMIFAGYVNAPTFLIWSENDVLFTIGTALQLLPPAALLHVFLSFPGGKVESRAERIVVAALYTAVFLALPALILGHEAPRNVIALLDQPAVAEIILVSQLLLVSGLGLAGLVLLALRRRRDGRPLRATLGYLVDSFALTILMGVLLLLSGLFEWTAVQSIRLATFGVVGVAPIVFLVALLQARLGVASVTELLVSIGPDPGPKELQQAVAKALKDPSVTLAYWLPEFDAYADVDGHQIDPSLAPDRSSVPIIRDGIPVAMILYDAALDDEPKLVASVAAATGLTIRNAQLQVELRARLEELRGSRARIVDAEQRERRRLERDLHDGAQQRLISLSLELGELSSQLEADDQLILRIEAARHEVMASIAELRDLAYGIHPAAVTDYGLAVALESLATRATVPVQVICTTDRLPEPIELAAYFIVCEALANVSKHSHATSAVVELGMREGDLIVEVRDDGIGGASVDTGAGLRGLADRVEALGGHLRVWSARGRGTRLQAEIPCG